MEIDFKTFMTIAIIVLFIAFIIIILLEEFYESDVDEDWDYNENYQAYINSLEVNEPNELKATETHK